MPEKPIVGQPRPDYQERVIEEKKQLDDKITRLQAFLDPAQIHGVNPQEHDRLKRQLDIMKQYSSILDERIINFTF